MLGKSQPSTLPSVINDSIINGMILIFDFITELRTKNSGQLLIEIKDQCCILTLMIGKVDLPHEECSIPSGLNWARIEARLKFCWKVAGARTGSGEMGGFSLMLLAGKASIMPCSTTGCSASTIS